ncbi:alpha/beta fold hydrolase, partial [Candidatus Shapirobacteria bacterium]|nr:alpha/beta fold hydrolase [Candidatus Shapirobacteria bacterium]
MSKFGYHKFFITLFIIICLFILSQKRVFAFQEEFDNYPLNDQVWEVYQNEGAIAIVSGAINISAGNTRIYPFIFSKSSPIPTSGDFSVKFRIKYNSATTKGAGLVLATDVPPNGCNDTPLNDPLFSKRYFLEVWQDSIGGFFFAYSGDCYNTSCSLDQVIVYKKGSIDLNYHDIEFRYSSSQYLIFLDNNQVFISNPTPVRPSYLWFGSPTTQGPGHTWTSFSLDYILINPYLTPTPSPTPNPTPTPTPLQPIVLLPGLGGSWNHENMILGIEKPQSEWSMTPGIKVYEGLIETFKNADYQTDGDNKNLFIFNYNWAKPVDSTSEDLKNYIQNVVQPLPQEKIDLVGHSLGGLVARTYVQNNPDNPVDQLLTLGSPLKGIPSLYYPWEGGNLSKSLSGWQRIGTGLLLHLRKPGFFTTMETVRSVIPSLKDMLPTFNYLKENSQEKTLQQMSQKNDWLIGLNSSLPNHLISITNNLVGLLPNSTLKWINIIPPSWLDKILGFWVDGKPQSDEYDDGDQTVLAESAVLNGADVVNLENIGHQELVTSNEGQQKIMEVLDLSPSSISTISNNINYEPSLVFAIASPATISAILEPNGNLTNLQDSKLAIIPNAIEGSYKITIIGVDQGNYNLHIGQIINIGDIWSTISDSINTGERKLTEIYFNHSSPLNDPLIDQTGEKHVKSTLIKLLDLKNYVYQQNINDETKTSILALLGKVIRLLNKNQLEDTIISLYQLRFHITVWQKEDNLDLAISRYL